MMSQFFTFIRRSHAFRMLFITLLATVTSLVDHAMFNILGWSLLITWQLFGSLFLIKNSLSPLLLTCVGLVFDTLSGTIMGYTALLLLILQILTILFQDFFRALPHPSKSLFMMLLLLFMIIPEWILSCIMMQEITSVLPLLPTRLPCALSFPIFYTVLERFRRIIASHESIQS